MITSEAPLLANDVFRYAPYPSPSCTIGRYGAEVVARRGRLGSAASMGWDGPTLEEAVSRAVAAAEDERRSNVDRAAADEAVMVGHLATPAANAHASSAAADRKGKGLRSVYYYRTPSPSSSPEAQNTDDEDADGEEAAEARAKRRADALRYEGLYHSSGAAASSPMSRTVGAGALHYNNTINAKKEGGLSSTVAQQAARSAPLRSPSSSPTIAAEAPPSSLLLPATNNTNGSGSGRRESEVRRLRSGSADRSRWASLLPYERQRIIHNVMRRLRRHPTLYGRDALCMEDVREMVVTTGSSAEMFDGLVIKGSAYVGRQQLYDGLVSGLIESTNLDPRDVRCEVRFGVGLGDALPNILLEPMLPCLAPPASTGCGADDLPPPSEGEGGDCAAAAAVKSPFALPMKAKRMWERLFWAQRCGMLKRVGELRGSSLALGGGGASMSMSMAGNSQTSPPTLGGSAMGKGAVMTHNNTINDKESRPSNHAHSAGSINGIANPALSAALGAASSGASHNKTALGAFEFPPQPLPMAALQNGANANATTQHHQQDAASTNTTTTNNNNRNNNTNKGPYLPSALYYKVCHDARVGLGAFCKPNPSVAVLWASWDDASVAYLREHVFDAAGFEEWMARDAAYTLAATGGGGGGRGAAATSSPNRHPKPLVPSPPPSAPAASSQPLLSASLGGRRAIGGSSASAEGTTLRQSPLGGRRGSAASQLQSSPSRPQGKGRGKTGLPGNGSGAVGGSASPQSSPYRQQQRVAPPMSAVNGLAELGEYPRDPRLLFVRRHVGGHVADPQPFKGIVGKNGGGNASSRGADPTSGSGNGPSDSSMDSNTGNAYVLRTGEILFPPLRLSSGNSQGFVAKRTARNVATIVLIALDSSRADAEACLNRLYAECPHASRYVELACLWAGPDGLQGELATILDTTSLPCVMGIAPADLTCRSGGLTSSGGAGKQQRSSTANIATTDSAHATFAADYSGRPNTVAAAAAAAAKQREKRRTPDLVPWRERRPTIVSVCYPLQERGEGEGEASEEEGRALTVYDADSPATFPTVPCSPQWREHLGNTRTSITAYASASSSLSVPNWAQHMALLADVIAYKIDGAISLTWRWRSVYDGRGPCGVRRVRTLQEGARVGHHTVGMVLRGAAFDASLAAHAAVFPSLLWAEEHRQLLGFNAEGFKVLCASGPMRPLLGIGAAGGGSQESPSHRTAHPPAPGGGDSASDAVLLCVTCEKPCEGDYRYQCLHCDASEAPWLCSGGGIHNSKVPPFAPSSCGASVCERCVITDKHSMAHVLLHVPSRIALKMTMIGAGGTKLTRGGGGKAKAPTVADPTASEENHQPRTVDDPPHAQKGGDAAEALLLWGHRNVSVLPTMRGVFIPSTGRCHVGIYCHRCQHHIYNVRWKCAQCYDYDLCDACHRVGVLAEAEEREQESARGAGKGGVGARRRGASQEASGDAGSNAPQRVAAGSIAAIREKLAAAEDDYAHHGVGGTHSHHQQGPGHAATLPATVYRPWHHFPGHIMMRIACPTPSSDTNSFLLTSEDRGASLSLGRVLALGAEE